MADRITKYRNQVKRQLWCTGSVRKKLLQELDAMIMKCQEEASDPAQISLEASIGPPGNIAALLMGAVTSEEHQQYQKSTQTLKIALAILGTLLLCFVIYVFFFMDQSVIRYFSFYEGPPIQ